ncbi:hypothetical protein N7540_000444 [Penicillium herquei]|nr:hypothetical protein N7540_000444 [Penicillium herquei]
MGLWAKSKRLFRKKKSIHTSKETGGVSSSTTETTTCGPAGSSSAITTINQPSKQVVLSTPLPANEINLLPVASAQPRVSDTVALALNDKFEPWNHAYAMLVEREPELMEDYKKHLASLHELSTDGDSWSVESIVKQLLENRQKKQWRVSLLGKEVKIREQSERLAKFLLWSSPIVQSAVSSQPYAALAWSGVSLLLPLLTSGTTSNEDMLKGFNSIGDIQVYWEICERTYLRPSQRHVYQDLMEPLVKLYSHIVEYQARAICHLSSAQLSRAWQNVAGWSDWDGKVAEIDDLSKRCISLIEPLEAKKTQERWDTQMTEMQTSQRFLNEIWEVLQASRKQAQMNYEDQNERALLQDLASNYHDFKNFNPLRVQGTCEWFFADERFCNWRDSRTSGLLWISAGPGCGKSVLSRALIDERRLSTQVTTSKICHFFFKDGDERRMHPANAFCAILHQLFMHDSSSSLIQHALARYKSYGNNLAQNFGELWEIFIDCAGSLDTAELVCVIDALDECQKDGRRQFIEQLKQFYSQPRCPSEPLSKLKFLVTSRPYHDIETSFKGFSDTATYMHFDGDHKSALIGKEINLVIDARVNEVTRDFEEGDRQIIADKLKSMEQRTYLWLHLTFEIIESSSAYSKRGDIETLLSSLPSKVSEAYEKILERSDDQIKTEMLLQIVLAAVRPLTLDETNEALTLALHLERKDIISYSDLKPQLWPKRVFESTVKNLCGLFLSVYDSKLSFIHQTAREFLIDPTNQGKWQGRLNMSKSHCTMTLVSLGYLSFLDDKSPPSETMAKFSLAQYSAQYWMDHARPVETEKDVQESVLNFFLQREQAYNAWTTLFDPDWGLRDDSPRMYSLVGTPLYSASLMNLPHSVKLLLNTATSINKECGYLGSALDAACDKGHKDVVQQFLNKGANPELAGLFGTALQVACSKGHIEIAQLLLESGLDVNIQCGEFNTALQAACYFNRIESVRLLLEKGADANTQCVEYGTALQCACTFKYIEIAQLLLEKGADVNLYHREFGTPLQIACGIGYIGLIQLLLENGAEVNTQGGKNATALQVACAVGIIEVVQLLLENGADVNTQYGEYGPALQSACTVGIIEVVQLLLENGADVNTRDEQYGTALQTACDQGVIGIVQLLLENSADVNTEGGLYGTALQTACIRGIIGIVQLLLDNGADVNTQGGLYGTALQAACDRGDIEIVQLLLENGADINTQGGVYDNALNAASEKGHEGVVQLLLGRGAC